MLESNNKILINKKLIIYYNNYKKFINGFFIY